MVCEFNCLPTYHTQSIWNLSSSSLDYRQGVVNSIAVAGLFR